MTTELQKAFLEKVLAHAQLAGHLFPEYAACEAALESAWGNSKLAREGCNLFGEKVHKGQVCDVLEIPTEEFIRGEWVTEVAYWIKFPSWTESFASRMDTLRRLAGQYPGYADALAAKSGEDFVTSVSRHWSTDPLRGKKVLTIHSIHFKDGQIV